MAVIDATARAMGFTRPQRTPTARIITQESPPDPSDELPPGFVSGHVLARDEIPEESRLGVGTEYVHVSSAVDLCARQHVLANLYGVELSNQVRGGHRIMWEIGHAVERHVVRQFITSHGAQNVFGVWTCPCGRGTQVGFGDGLRADGTGSAHSCGVCGRQIGVASGYHELMIINEEVGVSGRPDLTAIVDTPVGTRTLVVEVKSMNHDQWNELEAPLGDHVAQALLYRWIYLHGAALPSQAESTIEFVVVPPVHDSVVLLYASKGYVWGNPYREFHVDATAPASLEIVAEALVRVEQYHLGMTDGSPLPDRVCPSQDCGRAHSCRVSHLCFSTAD